jgi:hypothetical protein
MQFQGELPQSLAEFYEEPIGFRLPLEFHEGSSSPEELHPQALTEPAVRLSPHPALRPSLGPRAELPQDE